MDKKALVGLLRSRVDGLLAIYAFGSRVQGTAGEGSDLDLAVLVKGYVDPLVLWALPARLPILRVVRLICWICAGLPP